MSMQVGELMYQDDFITSLLKNRFFAELVSKEEGHKSILREGSTYLNVNVSFSFPTLAVIEPSGFSKGGREKREYMEQIWDYLQLRNAEESIVFLDEDGRIALLFSWMSREAIEGVQAQVSERFGHSINIGVGLPRNKLSDMHLSYRQALLALEDKFYQGVGRIMYYNELSHYRRVSIYPIAKERELFETIKNNRDIANIKGAVNAFYEYLLQEGPLHRQNIDELTIRLLLGLEKKLLVEGKEESAFSSYHGFEILSITQMETLTEVKAYVCKLLQGLLESVALDPSDQPCNIIKKTIEYMEREYVYATLHNTAQKVFMTPTYLSALFKMNTGKTFIEQLTDIRIKKAKHMLKHTHLKNYEVAEKVGYSDSRYFSQIFKKKVGLSPSEYRESAAN
jgi:two-component system response regulator YesN